MTRWSPVKVDNVTKYVETAIGGFVKDPPDSDFQRGYLSALINIWDEAFEIPDTDIIAQARKL